MKKPKKSLLVTPKKELLVVHPDEPLPGIFDTMWDAKTGSDLDHVDDEYQRRQIRAALAQEGYDANRWYDESNYRRRKERGILDRLFTEEPPFASEEPPKDA